MSRFKSLFLSVIFVLYSSVALSTQEESFINFVVHNIGQGNCMTAEIYDHENKKHNFFLMDAGSSAYKQDFDCQEYFREKYLKQDQEEKDLPKPQSVSSLLTTPKLNSISSILSDSDIQKPTPGVINRRARTKNTKNKRAEEKVVQDKINEIRKALGAKTSSDSINLKTIFISHPDIDHYNWMPKIFNGKTCKDEEDRVENIILGGLPIFYNCGLLDWLQVKINQGTHVYFPAILCEQPILFIDRLFPKVPFIYPSYAPQMHSHPTHGWDSKKYEHLELFDQTLFWSDQIKMYLLTVNPTHFQEENNNVFRSSLEGDDNSDSLVLKLKIGDYSIIITGDATNITTQRVQRNYENFDDFFDEKIILTTDHHGSYTHGSNREAWINEIKPSYVVCSNGTKFSHPSIEAYQRFKDVSTLVKLTPSHNVWVYAEEKDPVTQKKPRLPKNHRTRSAFFSTFNSGTIQFYVPLMGEVVVKTDITTFQLLPSETIDQKQEGQDVVTPLKLDEKEKALLHDSLEVLLVKSIKPINTNLNQDKLEEVTPLRAKPRKKITKKKTSLDQGLLKEKDSLKAESGSRIRKKKPPKKKAKKV